MRTTDVMLAYFDPDFNFVWVNPAYAASCQKTPEELIGRNHFDLYPHDENEAIFRHVRDTGESVFYKDKPFAYPDQPERGVTYWDWSLSPVTDDADAVTGLVFSLRETTEYVTAEKARRRGEESLKRTQQIAHLGSWELVVDEDRLTWSDEAYRIFGLEPQEFGSTYEAFLDRVHPEDRAAVDEAYTSSLRENRDTYEIEHRIVRKDTGEIRLVREKCDHFRDADGRIVRSVGMVHDISEQKVREQEHLQLYKRLQETQRLEGLAVLAGGIAHDFNNILMVIIGQAELAAQAVPSSSPAHKSLDAIMKASRRAADLCAQMLACAGKGQLEKQDLSLACLAEETLLMLDSSVLKQCTLDLKLERQLPFIHGDPSQIRRILVSLVTNASEAVGNRDGVIALTTGTMECSAEYLADSYFSGRTTPGPYVYLEVSDTGCGIEKEDMQHIFDPFFTTKFVGRGLGLSAVMGIVRAHEGTLRVDSKQGEGTTFRVLFPAVPPAQKSVQPPAEPAEWRGEGTVLLVDDEELVRALCEELLQRMGLEVLTAEDGRRAVDLYRVRQAEIDVVLLDLTMPRMNGEEAYGELRKINPAVPVILASGYGRSDVVARFKGKDLVGCLQKPYTPEKLRSLLSGLLPARQENGGDE